MKFKIGDIIHNEYYPNQNCIVLEVHKNYNYAKVYLYKQKKVYADANTLEGDKVIGKATKLLKILLGIE